jgi:hypothetical protein
MLLRSRLGRALTVEEGDPERWRFESADDVLAAGLDEIELATPGGGFRVNRYGHLYWRRMPLLALLLVCTASD